MHRLYDDLMRRLPTFPEEPRVFLGPILHGIPVMRAEAPAHALFDAHPVSEAWLEGQLERLALPQGRLWIEDPASGVMISELADQPEGPAARRLMLEAAPLNAPETAFEDGGAQENLSRYEGIFAVTGGIVERITAEGDQLRCTFTPRLILMSEPTDTYILWAAVDGDPAIMVRQILAAAERNIMAAVKTLLYAKGGAARVEGPPHDQIIRSARSI